MQHFTSYLIIGFLIYHQLKQENYNIYTDYISPQLPTLSGIVDLPLPFLFSFLALHVISKVLDLHVPTKYWREGGVARIAIPKQEESGKFRFLSAAHPPTCGYSGLVPLALRRLGSCGKPEM